MYLGRALRRNASRSELVEKLGDLERAIQSLMPTRAPNALLSHTRVGTAVRPVPSAAGISVRRLFLRSVEDDYLSCTATNDPDDDTEILVAKPWKLRRTPWDGQVFTVEGSQLEFTYTSSTARTVSDGTESENQVITEPYIEEVDWIFAVSAETDVEDGSGNSIRLQELNTDARAWAKV